MVEGVFDRVPRAVAVVALGPVVQDLGDAEGEGLYAAGSAVGLVVCVGGEARALDDASDASFFVGLDDRHLGRREAGVDVPLGNRPLAGGVGDEQDLRVLRVQAEGERGGLGGDGGHRRETSSVWASRAGASSNADRGNSRRKALSVERIRMRSPRCLTTTSLHSARTVCRRRRAARLPPRRSMPSDVTRCSE